jgi:hypothetical protein
MGGTCSTHEETGNSFTILIINPQGKTLLERPGVDWRIILK